MLGSSFIKSKNRFEKITLLLAVGLIVLVVGVLLTRHAAEQRTGLSGFVTLTKEDPLFYSPFPDSATYLTELKNLQNAERELMEISVQNIKDTGIRAEVYVPIFENFTLFPYEYLATLPLIASSTERFLAHPNEDRALELLALYESALVHYRASVDGHLATFETLFKHFTPEELGYYFFVDSGTSVELVYEDMKLIRQNAEALANTINERRACLVEGTDCLVLTRDAFEPRVSARTFSVDENLIDPRRAEIVRNNMSYQDSIESVTGPYAVYSECWYTGSDTAYDPMYLYTYKSDDAIYAVMPKLADETYYSYVPENPVREIDKYLHSQGVPYASQLEGTMYQCPDLSYYPEILTADYIAHKADRLSQTPENIMASKENTLLLENMFGLLAPAFDVIANNLHLLRDTQRLTTDNIVSPQHLLATRSAYSIVFMPYARSVWRIDTQPTYFLPRDANLIERLRMDHIRLSELVNMGFSDETIRPLHFTQVDYVTELLEKKEESE